MNFKFYIFGTPYYFNLYPDDDASKIEQFQLYKNENSVNVRFMIQRSGTQITYSYLRYHLLSVTNAYPSFFGMAVEFKNEYCTKIKDMYDLFEAIYFGVILKKGILLNQTNKQTKFSVPSFKEGRVVNEIKEIETIVKKNINNLFASDFKPFNKSFKQGINDDKLAKMNIETSNRYILQVMKDYSKLSLSPEYPNPAKTPKRTTQEQLSGIGNIVQILTEKVSSLENKIISQQEIKTERGEMKTERTVEVTENEVPQKEKKNIIKKEETKTEKVGENQIPQKEEENENNTADCTLTTLKPIYRVLWLICVVIALIILIWIVLWINQKKG
jgi:hypothetical protein